MAEFDVGFHRSAPLKREGTVCDEIAQLSRLKVAELINRSQEDDREVAAGAVVSEENIRFTENFFGERRSVQLEEIKKVSNAVKKISAPGGNRRECMIHTHPTGNFRPSPSDAKAIIASIGPKDERMLIRKDVPRFDCFFILGKDGRGRGAINGWLIEDRPPVEEYVEIVRDSLVMDFEDEPPDVKRDMSETMISLADKHITTCQKEGIDLKE